MAIHSSVIRSLKQSESIYKNTQTSTSLFPFAWGQAKYVSGRLIVKPRVTSKHPGACLCSRANILAKVPVQKLDTIAGLATSSDKIVTNLHTYYNMASAKCY